MRIIIIGAGEVGRNIAVRLCEERKDVVVVDMDDDVLRAVGEMLDVQTIVGSGSNPKVLREAGVEDAEMIISVTDHDEVNIVACLIAGSYSPNIIKIARIRSLPLFEDDKVHSYASLRLDLAINPERVAAQEIVAVVRHPWAADLIPFADGQIVLVAARVVPQGPIDGLELKAVRQRFPEPRFLIVARKRKGKVIIPGGDDVVRGGDLLYFVVSHTEVDQLADVIGESHRRVRSVMVGGASQIGMMICRELEKLGVNLKLIEPDEAVCERAAAELAKTIVIYGDSTDQELLQAEGIDATDIYVAASREEELNILAALLAKRLGAGKVLTVSDRIDYNDLISAIGVDSVISPRSAAVSSILHFIRRGRVLRVTAIGAGDAEAIEFQALRTSDVVGRPLKEVSFPKGAIFGGIVRRDKTIIPDGNDIIEAGDRVLVFVRRKAIPKVEKAMSVKLEFF